MPANRSRPYRLSRDEEVAAGLTRVAAGRAEKALERLRASSAGELDSAEAVHGARKDMKKLRTVLRLLRDALDKKRFRRENERFRDAGRALSGARDAEVKLTTLEALVEHAEGLPEDAVESWRKILDRDREAATTAARDEPKVAAATAEIVTGLEEIESWDLTGDSWKMIGPGLTRTYRRGRKAMKTAEAGGEADFHQWRKRAKDLWHELRLLSDAWPGPLTATAEEAHQLSELLGDHHDLAVLREDLHQRRLGAEETQTLQAAIDRRQDELAAEALALGRRLYAERPKEFSRRLERYWRAWRS